MCGWLAVMGAALSYPERAQAQRSTPVRVLHPAGQANDRFGFAIAVDGDTMVVGAVADDFFRGSAHVYRWTGTGWAFEATLTAADGEASDFFGVSVAISGDTVIVGAYNDDVGGNPDQGSAYVFVRSGTAWTQQARLTASDGEPSDTFGLCVGVSGDTVVVGTCNDDVDGKYEQGSAYVFVRWGTIWAQQAHLTASDGSGGDYFGGSIAIAGDSVVVGAYSDSLGPAVSQGSAYVFTRSGSAWTQQAYLTASDGAAYDAFGYSVAVSGDTVVVGSVLDTVSAGGEGSAYVFVRSGANWTQQAQLAGPNPASGDAFGFSVAISGDTAVVGVHSDDVGASADQGSAYIFTRSGTTWTQQAQLTASDGAASDHFGMSVGISGDTAVVGANYDDVGANADQGSAWVFSRVGTKWIGPGLTLLSSDGAAGDTFGCSVALSGDTALVGAAYDDVSTPQQGSAYVFIRSGAAWIQQAQLTASDGALNDSFGYSVALSGDTALVGAAYDDVGANADEGSAYVFTRDGTTWTQQARLTASDGAASDTFGCSVALSGNTALVGVSADNVGANADQGSAYVFTRSGETWTQQAQLTASGGAAVDYFGLSVALSGDTALVGAHRDDVGTNADRGSAYVFTRSGTAWTQQAQLIASDGAAGDLFGYSVAFSGDAALVGAYAHAVGANPSQGSAYVFTRSGTTWTQQAQLITSDGVAYDAFGYSVALSGGTALVGAPYDDVGASNEQGSVYIFTGSGMTWTQQAQLTALDGAPSDYFGSAVALSGDDALVGVFADNAYQGSARVFDVPYDDFPRAHNDSLDITYPSLAAALLPAQSGHQITATCAAWSEIGSLDTLGRSLGLSSTIDLRTPSTSVLTLGGSSFLAAPLGGTIDISGQLRVSTNASADVFADHFRLGSRGILTARTGSSLTISAPSADLDGQTRLEQGAALTFLGAATAIGPTTAGLESSFTLGGSFTNIDTFTITSGTISAALLYNRAAFNVFGTSAVFGDFTNEAGAVTTIRGGGLYVFGTLTNNGTIIGSDCPGCLVPASILDVGGSLSAGPDASLIMPYAGSVVRVGGNLDCAIDSNTRFDLSLATLRLEGGGPEQILEVMSADIGPDSFGLDRTIPGNFPVGILYIGPTPSTVRLVDARDNDGQGQSACEAVYARDLVIDAGSRLINSAGIVYYNTIVNNGTVDFPGNLVQLNPPCPADYNHDGFVDGIDYDFFMADYESYDPVQQVRADFNGDGFVDGIDYDLFMAAFETLC